MKMDHSKVNKNKSNFSRIIIMDRKSTAVKAAGCANNCCKRSMSMD